MPISAPSACCVQGCARLSQSGSRCDLHQAEAQARAEVRSLERQKEYNGRRPESDRFYGTTAWRRLRDAYLCAHPLCVECGRHGVVAEAQVVDHVEPYKERPDLGLDPDNLRALCRRCHARIGRRVIEKKKTKV